MDDNGHNVSIILICWVKDQSVNFLCGKLWMTIVRPGHENEFADIMRHPAQLNHPSSCLFSTPVFG